MHILIVEDDPSWLQLVSAMLELAGHRVSAYADYRGALEVLEGRDGVDLLLTDIQLPAGTPHGVALAQMARTRRRRLPVLFMTGELDLASHVDPDLGPVLVKPFSRAVLLASVHSLAGRGEAT